jgi:hypothetical protein
MVSPDKLLYYPYIYSEEELLIKFGLRSEGRKLSLTQLSFLLSIYQAGRKKRRNLNRVELITKIKETLNSLDFDLNDHFGNLPKSSKLILSSEFGMTNYRVSHYKHWDITDVRDYLNSAKPLAVIQLIKRSKLKKV